MGDTPVSLAWVFLRGFPLFPRAGGGSFDFAQDRSVPHSLIHTKRQTVYHYS
jgi:hypothetical protein